MKFLLVAVLVTLAVAAVYASPVQDEADINDLGEFYGPNEGIRQRRVTCDLLSFGGMVGDSACAANCLSMGKAGGRCNGGICQCRVTTIKDVWDKRFG